MADNLAAALNTGHKPKRGSIHMKFDGKDLVRVLTQQRDPLKVPDDLGREYLRSPAKALEVVRAGGYYGVGHRRRIRYIRETPERTSARRAADKEARKAREMLVGAAKTWTGCEPARTARASDPRSRRNISFRRQAVDLYSI